MNQDKADAGDQLMKRKRFSNFYYFRSLWPLLSLSVSLSLVYFSCSVIIRSMVTTTAAEKGEMYSRKNKTKQV